MSTVTIPSPHQASIDSARSGGVVSQGRGEWRVVFRGVDWETYSKLVDSCGESSPLKLAFDGKDLEIMTVGNEHEILKELAGRLIHVITEEFEIPLRSVGETTWKRPEIKRGLEADQSYYFSESKYQAAALALAKHSNDVADYPNPDLAIEIDLSPSQIDRPSIYAALRVQEIWRYNRKGMIIERLTPEGSYVEVGRSGLLPIDAIEITRWLLDGCSSEETPWVRRFRAWVRDDLMPRAGGPR